MTEVMFMTEALARTPELPAPPRPESHFRPPLRYRLPWRRVSTGWVAVHALIGLVAGSILWFFVAFVVMLAVADTVETVKNTLILISFVIALVGTVVAWVSFVYIQRPNRIRWVVATSVIGATVIGSFWTLAAAFPWPT